MKFVILESPFAGTPEQVRRNRQYALDAMRDSLYRGESPFASHILYTECLDDNNEYERKLGISAGLNIGERADATVVYVDHGLSNGMIEGIKAAQKIGRKIEYRSLYTNNSEKTAE